MEKAPNEISSLLRSMAILIDVTDFYIQLWDGAERSGAANRSPSEVASSALSMTRSICFHNDLKRGSSGRSNLHISPCVQEAGMWHSLGLPGKIADAGSTI